MVNHILTITAPGFGTVNDLQDAAEQLHGDSLYRNIATDSWEDNRLIGRLEFLKDGSLDGKRTVIIDGFDQLAEEERGSIIERVRLWTAENSERQLTVSWVLVGYSANEERDLSIAAQILPLITGIEF